MARILVKLRREALDAQKGRCFYCRLPVWEQNGKRFARQHGFPARLARYLRCTAEHLIARQDQGGDVKQNIVAACFWCNHQRHHYGGPVPDPSAWQATVRSLVSSGIWHPATTNQVQGGDRCKLS